MGNKSKSKVGGEAPYFFFVKSTKKTLITLVDGEPVNLTGEPLTTMVRATKSKPAHETTIRGATQADLKKLYEQGNNLIGYESRTKVEAEETKEGE